MNKRQPKFSSKDEMTRPGVNFVLLCDDYRHASVRHVQAPLDCKNLAKVAPNCVQI